MKEADNVIVLYNGRVLGKGSFKILKEEGILNTTVDPLLKIMKGNIFDWDNEEKDEVSDNCDKNIPGTNEAKGLQISEEDCTSGVLSSQLYWSYFKSGVPSLVIIGLFCWCLIAQGKPKNLFLFPSLYTLIGYQD